MLSSRTGSFSFTALLAAGLTVLVAAAAGVGVALAATAAGSSPNPTFEVRLEHLHDGSYKDAGDYPTQFGPAVTGKGVWQVVASSSGAPELGFIEESGTASGMIEVHLEAVSGGIYRDAGDYLTKFPVTDAAKGKFQLVSSSGGPPELGLIKWVDTPSKMVNVLLEAVSGGSYQAVGNHKSDFPAAEGTAGTWQLLPTGGAPELALIATASGPSSVVVHLDGLSGKTYQRVANYPSKLSAPGAGIWQLFGSSGGAPELAYAELKPGPIVVRWGTLSSGAYQPAGKYTSAFSSSLASAGAWQLFGTGSAPVLALVKTPAPTTTTTAPVTVTTVVTEPLPIPPPPKPHRRGRVRARFVISYRFAYAHTRILRVRISHFPRRARITVRCYGRGCPRLAVAAGYRRLGGALRSLGGRVLGAGELLEITVTSPGLVPERIGVRIRDGEKPRARLL